MKITSLIVVLIVTSSCTAVAPFASATGECAHAATLGTDALTECYELRRFGIATHGRFDVENKFVSKENVACIAESDRYARLPTVARISGGVFSSRIAIA